MQFSFPHSLLMALYQRASSFLRCAESVTWFNHKMKNQARGFFTSSFRSKQANKTSVSDLEGDVIHRYNAGRWLWNESDQLAQRYARFNIGELASVAAKSKGCSTCIEIEKLPEGNFNKTFLLTFDNGSQAIARLPNPNAGCPHFSTASEVATMDFVRDVLNIPVPKIYAWSSKAWATPVQAEYIIMEKVQGKELSHFWDDLSGRQKYEIVTQLVEFESRFASSRFTKLGSLYYRDDVLDSATTLPLYIDQQGMKQNCSRFVVGPTNNRMFFDNGRSAVEIDRGPWNTAEEYAIAMANREIACVENRKIFPRPQGVFSGPGQYKPTAAAKISALRDYLKVAKHLLPKDKNFHSAILWHGDLHTDNIFVDPENPTKIVGIIDWQSAHISPLFLQARHPALLDFEGSIPESFDIALPEDYSTQSLEEQERAKKLRSLQSLYKLYEIASFKSNRDIYQAIRVRNTLGVQITGLVGSIFSDGEPLVQSLLATVQSKWEEVVGFNNLMGDECPLSFTEEQKEKIAEEEKLWREGVELLDALTKEVGAYTGWDGWVSHDEYEPMKERVRACRERFLRDMANAGGKQEEWERVFPFPVVG